MNTGTGPRSAGFQSAPEPEDNWTQARLKALVMAAVRVWELKQGIRD